MKKEISYGIVPLLKKKDEWHVLLVFSGRGFWGLPKGHKQSQEDGKEAAVRELLEETNLNVVRFLTEETFLEHYSFLKGTTFIDKTVVYYIAEVSGDIVLQKEEIHKCSWVKLPAAKELATYPETKRILFRVEQLLTGKD